ncbi:MAG: hypothetical protein ORN54_13955, partial [Cyclobacteriaceae bacterium]|nr:hypothetical protein [Cyclobacteriaceae bacterium]
MTNQICQKLKILNIEAETIIEPTCGKGNFLVSAKRHFPKKKLLGFEVNDDYVTILNHRSELQNDQNIKIFKSNFFETDWKSVVQEVNGTFLVLGNLPWVTNSSQGVSNGKNLPVKSNFHQLTGIEAITGKSNFDISEYMMIEILSWFKERSGTVALLLKTAVARKTIAYAQKHRIPLQSAKIFKINSKKAFNVSVDACLLLLQLDQRSPITYDYKIYDDLDSSNFQRIGHRDGLTVANLDDFHKYSYLAGGGSTRWRSGIKHDLASIMELVQQGGHLVNGLGEEINIERELIYPLMKGSDVAGAKFSNGKYIVVTQAFTGEDTEYIKAKFPKT